MSATLNVSVILCTFEDDLDGGANIVGNIYPAGATGFAQRNIVFPCGISVTPARYEVEAGRYIVSATLPSGAMLTEDVEAREGEETLVTLDASDSPYETHSWQYLMGNIEPSSVYHAPSTIPVPRSTGSRYIVRPGGTDGAAARFDAESPPLGQPKVTWIAASMTASWSFESMIALATGAARAPIADLIAESLSQIVPRPDESDGTSHLFRFGVDGPVGAPSGFHGARQFLVVELADAAHLVTLPAPWASAQIEVLVNERQSPTGSAIAVTVRDRDMGAALAYMARGAFDAAATLFTDVESMLYGKIRNPLAAAAGGYVLVGRDVADEPKHWDSWLGNLRDWFDWMSDGSVLWAARRLRQAKTEGDLQQARDGLIEAYNRGVPLYTLGLSWLMDGLSEFPEDPECAWRLEQARQLSWCVDMREPFVIISLRGRPR